MSFFAFAPAVSAEMKLLFFDVEVSSDADYILQSIGFYVDTHLSHSNTLFVTCTSTKQLLALVRAFAQGRLARAGLAARSVKPDNSLGNPLAQQARELVQSVQNERTLVITNLPNGVSTWDVESACANCEAVRFVEPERTTAFVRFVDTKTWRACASLGCRRLLTVNGEIVSVAAPRGCADNRALLKKWTGQLRAQAVTRSKHHGVLPIDVAGSLEFYDWAVESLAPAQERKVDGLQQVPLKYGSIEQFCASRVAFLCAEAQAIARSGFQRKGARHRGVGTKLWSSGTKGAAFTMLCLLAPPRRDEEDYRSGEMLWLTKERLLAIVTSTKDARVRGQISARVILSAWRGATVDEDDREIGFGYLRLGSLLSLRRMLETLRDLRDSTMPIAASIVLDQRVGGGDGRRVLRKQRLDALPVAAALNAAQKNAALVALHDDSVNLSLLQGPPGSGKTTTIVTILQMLVQRQQPCIVCAPSNKAVHEILERFVLKMPDVPVVCVGVAEKAKSEVVRDNLWEQWSGAFRQRVNRIVALHKATIDGDERKKPALMAKIVELVQREEALMQYFTDSDSFRFDIERRIAALQTFRVSQDDLIGHAAIVFVTLISSRRKTLTKALAARPSSYLIVDEAGQALESELLAPMYASLTDVLLVGDPRQLPATVISDQAQKFGFAKSAMERLGASGHVPHRMLDTQYRMHSQINRWPSEQFYGGRLTAYASLDSRVVPWAGSKELERIFRRSRSIFIDCNAEAQQSGTSRRNKAQVDLFRRVLDMLSAGGVDTRVKCGIISPYLAQVQLIKQQLGERVGACATVDGFQGGEFDIILISFVHYGAFVADAQRVNVAVTRARHALIMCGNKQKLQKNPLFANLIRSSVVTREFGERKKEEDERDEDDDEADDRDDDEDDEPMLGSGIRVVVLELHKALKKTSRNLALRYGVTATKLCNIYRAQTKQDLLKSLGISHNSQLGPMLAKFGDLFVVKGAKFKLKLAAKKKT